MLFRNLWQIDLGNLITIAVTYRGIVYCLLWRQAYLSIVEFCFSIGACIWRKSGESSDASMRVNVENARESRVIALASPILGHIGEVDAVPRLARAIAGTGYRVDLLQAWDEWSGVDRSSLPKGMRVVDLNLRKWMPWMPSIKPISSWANYRMWSALSAIAMAPAMRRYLKTESPDVLIPRMMTAPILGSALVARANTKVILSMGGLPKNSPMRSVMWKWLYPKASGFVAPTASVAQAASDISGIPSDQFKIIPNPVIDKSVTVKGNEPAPGHPWLGDPGHPLILAVGRMTRQKDFPTLIRALKLVRERVPARLMILGDGEHRNQLEGLIAELDLESCVLMSGFEPNPYKYMKTADLFVMPSLWEGPGHVLIEAQAMGTPAISTDCPAGPADTLLHGEAGWLTPVGDHTKMSEAILEVIASPDEAKRRVEIGLKASNKYLAAEVGKRWAGYLDEMLNGTRTDAR
jgi:glycosyltransferase involved in cell wall biosynthesis